MKKYTAAIIGTGRIGFFLGFDKKREQPASHSFALAKNKRIELVAGCDTDSERLLAWQRCFPKAKSYSSVDEMLGTGFNSQMNDVSDVAPAETSHNATDASPHVCNSSVSKCPYDIIVVAVNEKSHLECALKAIQAKPRLVILEKPVALNMEQAEKIEQCAQKNCIPVMVNHERRFAKDYRLTRSFIDKIGDIQSIDARLYSGLRVYRKDDEATGEYSLLHDGTHLVDIVLYFLEALFPNGTNDKEGGSGETLSAVILENPKLTTLFCDKEGTVRNLGVNYSCAACPDVNIYISGRSRFFAFEITVNGTEGRINIGNGYAKIYSRKESKLYSGFYSLEKVKSVKFPKKTEYFSGMVKNAVNFLDGNEKLISTLKNGINSLKILEEIKKTVDKNIEYVL